MNISIAQALALWSRLEKCRHNEDSYGGTEAEIYAYTLMPSRPGYSSHPGSPILDAENRQAEMDAGRALREIAWRFMEMYPGIAVEIEVDTNVWVPLASWNDSLVHRIHVRVRKPRKAKPKAASPAVGFQSLRKGAE